MVYHFYNSVILVTITLFGIAGGKGGAMGLQPHLFLECSVGFYFLP